MGRFVFFVSLLLISLLCLSCGKKSARFPSPPVPADLTLHRARDDEDLARIAQNARDTLPVFFRRLQTPLSGDGNFRLKYPLAADPRSGFSREQVWLMDIRFKDSVYSGVLANTPYYVSGVARGERINFNIEEITDWMFTWEEKIIGGFSIKYLLEQIPEYERDEEQRRILGMFDWEARAAPR
ncbi:MAG: DUF2314 domain-containing protein [Treponema sp.]|jgi:uncharacterized protein YegJ (DUF2314 family)|nr:DUF2314 domain-containing protein [Treponema sp.]